MGERFGDIGCSMGLHQCHAHGRELSRGGTPGGMGATFDPVPVMLLSAHKGPPSCFAWQGVAARIGYQCSCGEGDSWPALKPRTSMHEHKYVLEHELTSRE